MDVKINSLEDLNKYKDKLMPFIIKIFTDGINDHLKEEGSSISDSTCRGLFDMAEGMLKWNND